MKIQLEYNPNTSETQLLINGVADRSMYNPFFQVNGYPLQSWLKKRLAWAGLAETVGSLARSSSVEFTFVGRRIDYDDVVKVLRSKLPYVTLSFIPKYEAVEDCGFSVKLDNILKAYPQANPYIKDNGVRRIVSLLTAFEAEKPIEITSNDQYLNKKDSLFLSSSPLFIQSDIYRLNATEIESRISKSFIRPFDSVYIILNSPTDRSYFLDQIELGMHVDVEKNELKNYLNKKYLKSICLWNDPAWYSRWNSFWDEINAIHQDVIDEKQAMKGRILHSGLSDDQERKMDTLDLWISWYKKNYKELLAIHTYIQKVRGVS